MKVKDRKRASKRKIDKIFCQFKMPQICHTGGQRAGLAPRLRAGAVVLARNFQAQGLR
jgi:hypothetical protein